MQQTLSLSLQSRPWSRCWDPGQSLPLCWAHSPSLFSPVLGCLCVCFCLLLLCHTTWSRHSGQTSLLLFTNPPVAGLQASHSSCLGPHRAFGGPIPLLPLVLGFLSLHLPQASSSTFQVPRLGLAVPVFLPGIHRDLRISDFALLEISLSFLLGKTFWPPNFMTRATSVPRTQLATAASISPPASLHFHIWLFTSWHVPSP